MQESFSFWTTSLEDVTGWTRGMDFQCFEYTDDDTIVGVFEDDFSVVRIEWRGTEAEFVDFCEL